MKTYQADISNKFFWSIIAVHAENLFDARERAIKLLHGDSWRHEAEWEYEESLKSNSDADMDDYFYGIDQIIENEDYSEYEHGHIVDSGGNG